LNRHFPVRPAVEAGKTFLPANILHKFYFATKIVFRQNSLLAQQKLSLLKLKKGTSAKKLSSKLLSYQTQQRLSLFRLKKDSSVKKPKKKPVPSAGYN